MKARRISLRRPTQDRVLAVEAGQVVCPHHGAVDLERCWVCPAYDGLSTGRLEGVVCRADLGDASVGLRSTTA
jgi:hypothetical protein